MVSWLFIKYYKNLSNENQPITTLTGFVIQRAFITLTRHIMALWSVIIELYSLWQTTFIHTQIWCYIHLPPHLAKNCLVAHLYLLDMKTLCRWICSEKHTPVLALRTFHNSLHFIYQLAICNSKRNTDLDFK